MFVPFKKILSVIRFLKKTRRSERFVDEIMILLDNVSMLLTEANEAKADEYAISQRAQLKKIWNAMMAGNKDLVDKIFTHLIEYLIRVQKKAFVTETGQSKNNYCMALRPLLRSCSYLRAEKAENTRSENSSKKSGSARSKRKLTLDPSE